MTSARARRVLAAVLLSCAAVWPARGQDVSSPATEPATPEAIAHFLLHADIVDSHEVGKGVTGVLRLTLQQGRVTHDAAFQAIDEREPIARFRQGRAEIGFADTYHFNIAGYEVAKLLGLGHMVPVTVERRWRGRWGSLSWWVRFRFDQGERLEQAVDPPDVRAWNDQMYRVRVFAALIHDTDRNLGNLLITDDWKIWMIDFTRAFRRRQEIPQPQGLRRCDRRLLDRLEALDEADVRAAVGSHLNEGEISSMMARRDLIVAHYRRLVAERGEAAVLY